MREKVLEMKELKEELAFEQSAVNKARKLDSGASLDTSHSWIQDENKSSSLASVVSHANTIEQIVFALYTEELV